MTDQASQSEKRTKQSLARRLVKFGLISLVLLTVAAGALAAGAYYYVDSSFHAPGRPAVGGAEETVFNVPAGQGVSTIAERLALNWLISDPLIFRLGVMLNGAASELKAGEFAIPSGASMFEIMEILRSGKSILHRVTIPEGWTTAQIFREVEANKVLVGKIQSAPAEGDLLPETYLFQRGTSRQEIINRMQAEHDELLDRLWQNRAENLPFSTKEEAVILASIVEKETGIASERPRVAAVFVNRMRRGMRLESDPTIIYGLTGGEPLGRGLRQSELAKVTPYNTYEIDGLPPTPIANPGRDSIAAVLNPPDTKELFFVADGTGGHVFAETYREHQRNVAAWRRIERQRANGG